MLKTLNDKLKLMRSTRERCEDLLMTMGFLGGGAIKNLRVSLRKYFEDNEDERVRTNVHQEITRLINISDINRQAEDLLHSEAYEEEKKENLIQDDTSGHLQWLHKLIDLSISTNRDIFRMRAVSDPDLLREGHIVDAQDYLGSWHLSVICHI